MKFFMRLLSLFLVMLFFSVLTSCEKENQSEPTVQGINPFSNGGNERNMIVVISDLHLGADLDYAECKDNLPSLEKLLNQIKAAPNVQELVIAGDLLDEWFVPATTDTYQGKDQADFVQRIASTNKEVFDAFNQIIQDGNILVTYVPGNHDLTVTEENIELILPGINQAREEQEGLGTYIPQNCPLIAIEHCHRYNFFCAPDQLSNSSIAPGSILPPGYFFTRIATQHVIEGCETPGGTMPVVTPNETGDESQVLTYIYWNIWKTLMNELPIEEMFSDKMIITNIDGFTETYSINDLMPSQDTPGGYIDMNIYEGIVSNWNERQVLNKVAVNIPVMDAIIGASSNSVSDSMSLSQYFMNPNSDIRIVVFGHTHDAKIVAFKNHLGQKSIYANSGTWIDHNPDNTTTNFLVITPQDSESSSQTYIRLYNYGDEIVTKMDEDSLRY